MTEKAKTESSITPLFHSGSTRRRKAGRPKGAKAQVVQDARALGVHHFAFVRSPDCLGPCLAVTQSGVGMTAVSKGSRSQRVRDSVRLPIRQTKLVKAHI